MNIRRHFLATVMAACVLAAVLPTATRAQGDDSSAIDVIHYKINAELVPDAHTLTAHTVVTFKVLKQAQSAVFEMNGSLAISSIKGPDGKTELQFIQDKVNEYNVKINLGQLYPAGSTVTLAFDYSGPLATPDGGPIPDKRLAYVGPEGCYLFYAARWFPFHGYASDRATSEISITVPAKWTVAGHSDGPVATSPSKDGKMTFTFSETKPVLPGSFAAGQFISRSIKSAGAEIELNVAIGSDSRIDEFAKEIAQIIQFYSTRFGPYPYGTRYVVSEVDNDTLDSYSGPGVAFLSHRMVVGDKGLPVEELAREVAYQWWGQAVGLKKFDDAWLSQGLAEYSSVLYRESQQSSAEFQDTLAEILENALAFEADSSIARAPAQLNDQSPAYHSVVFYKGAYVFHMLRGTIGDDKFFNLLKSFFASYNRKDAGIQDFEAITDKVAGRKMRSFFGLWVDSTGVPEFKSDYTVLRTKAGKFKVRGTVRQNLDAFSGPVEIALESEGGRETKTTVELTGTSADFELYSEGKPLEVVIDPASRYMRISDSIRTAVVVRRGIQHLRREEYAEADEQFHAALKLSPRSSWAWYNLGMLHMGQRNWSKAIEEFSEALNGDLEPGWVEVWSYLRRGNAYDAQDKRDRAVVEYDKARDNGSNYNNAQRLVEKYHGEPYKPGAATANASTD